VFARETRLVCKTTRLVCGASDP